MTAKCPLEVRVSIGDVNCSTMCARSVATVQHGPGGCCECGHVLDTEGERHMPRSCTWKRRGRPPTVCESVPRDLHRKSEAGHTCLRGQRQFQENSLMKHFKPCGELAAGVREPVRPSADVTREEDFGGQSGGAEVEVRRKVSCAELAHAQNCVVRDSITTTDGHRR